MTKSAELRQFGNYFTVDENTGKVDLATSNLKVDSTTGYNIFQLGADDATGYHWVNEISQLNLYNGTVGNGNLVLKVTPSELLVDGNVKASSLLQDGATTDSLIVSQGQSTQSSSVALWGSDHATFPGQVHIVSNSSNVSADSGKISFWDFTGSSFHRNVTIDKNGYVGINTDNPATKLTIDGGEDVLLTLNKTNTWTNYADGHSIRILAPNQAINSNLVALDFGKAATTANAGHIDYTHVADDSNLNYISLGMYSRDKILVINGNRRVGINVDEPQYALHIKNTVTGNGTNGTIIIDRTDNVSYENALNWATAGTKKWFLGQDNNSTDDLTLYNWNTGTTIWNVSSTNDRLESRINYQGMNFVKLTSPSTWSATYTGQNDVTINVSSVFGIPSNAKAVLLGGYYHVSGYSAGSSGQGDHAVSMFRPNTSWSAGAPWSFNTSTDTGWGEYVLEHDGDASGAVHNYGAWTNGNGICGVNANGNIYGRLGWGLSGGTHYNTLWCWGYWI